MKFLDALLFALACFAFGAAITLGAFYHWLKRLYR